MKQLKLWVLGLSMVLAGCQTTTHLSAALKPQMTEAYARPVDQPFARIKKMESMKQKTLNHAGYGIIGGLVGALIGFCIFGIGFSWYNEIFFSEFVLDVFLGAALQDFQSRIISFEKKNGN